MPPVVSFSDHAIKRCKQQRINPLAVADAALKVPPTAGEIKWLVPDRFSIVMHFYPQKNKIIIITVIGVGKLDDRRANKWKKGRPR